MTCPDDYAFNCKNYEVQCLSCKAVNTEGERLFYSPVIIGAGLDQHPYIREAKGERSRLNAEQKEERNTEVAKRARYYNRKGKEIERKVIKSIRGAKLTFNSGATNNDSDGYIWIEDTKYVLSHKMRFSTKNLLGPTSAEWNDRGEGTDIWLTTSETYGTVVTMKQETLDELLDVIYRNSKAKEND